MLPSVHSTPVYTPTQSVPIQKAAERTGTAGEMAAITSVSNSTTEGAPSTCGIREWLWGALGAAMSSVALCPVGAFRMVGYSTTQRALQNSPTQEPSAVEMQPLNNEEKLQEKQEV